MVKNCQNYKDDGGFEDGICLPCYNFITTNEPNNSQAYRNTNLIKDQYKFGVDWSKDGSAVSVVKINKDGVAEVVFHHFNPSFVK